MRSLLKAATLGLSEALAAAIRSLVSPPLVGNRLQADHAFGIDGDAALAEDQRRRGQGQCHDRQQHDHREADASTTHGYQSPSEKVDYPVRSHHVGRKSHGRERDVD